MEARVVYWGEYVRMMKLFLMVELSESINRMSQYYQIIHETIFPHFYEYLTAIMSVCLW